MKGFAYGGIVFNAAGEVLMRSPRGFFLGAMFGHLPKGELIDTQDRTPEETAMREVREETGYVCEVIAPIPGEFESDTCVTILYLLRPIGIVHRLIIMKHRKFAGLAKQRHSS